MYLAAADLSIGRVLMWGLWALRLGVVRRFHEPRRHQRAAVPAKGTPRMGRSPWRARCFGALGVVRAMHSRDYEVQLQVVQRVEAALARQSRGRADAARDRGMRALGTARGPAGPSGGRGDTAP